MKNENTFSYYFVVLVISIFLGTLLYLFGLLVKDNFVKLYNKTHYIYWIKVPAAIESVSLKSVDTFPYDPELKGVFTSKKITMKYNYYFKGKRYENDSIGYYRISDFQDEIDIQVYKKIRN